MDQLKELTTDLSKADKLHRDAMVKLAAYNKLIEDALKIDDKIVQDKVSIHKSEAAEI